MINEEVTHLFKSLSHPIRVDTLSCYKMCSKGWDDTLLHLQQYVENGETNAHVPKTGLKGILSRSAFKFFSKKYMK